MLLIQACRYHFITWLLGFIGRLVLPETIESGASIALIVGSLGALTIVVNTGVTIFAAALFALIVVKFYVKVSEEKELPAPLAESDDLGENDAWSAAAVTETILSDDGQTQVVRAAVPMGAGNSFFLRLAVSK